MATVDLVCTYDTPLSNAWTSDGSTLLTTGDTSISSIDGNSAIITSRAQILTTSLAFQTNAASVIPSGSTINSIQLIARLRVSGGNGTLYVKNPGGFADGGAAAHTITFNSTMATYTSIDLAIEKPSVLTDPLTSGYLRMYHDSGFGQTFTVDYVSFRVTYTEGGLAIPQMFMMENF